MIRLLVFLLILSVFLNFYHYRSFFIVIFRKILCFHRVHINDEQGAWYTKGRLLINHAGNWDGIYKYPNSREEIDSCLSNKCPVIEVDVTLTRDGIPVLTHWFAPDGEIMFIKLPTLSEFLSKDCPGNHHTMTLDDLMNNIYDYDGNILIDVKMGNEKKVIEWFENNYSKELNKKIIFQVNSRKLLKELYRKNIFGYLHFNGDIKSLLLLLPYLKKYNVHSVSLSDWEIVDSNSIKQLKDSGLHVYVYTVNHSRRLKVLFDYGIDGVFTDCYKDLITELVS